MDFLSDNSAARAAITNFLIDDSTLAAEDRTKLNELGNSVRWRGWAQ